MRQDNFSQQLVIRRYVIQGSRTFSNFWWATVITLGGAGFILAGLSSFFQRDLLSFLTTRRLYFSRKVLSWFFMV